MKVLLDAVLVAIELGKFGGGFTKLRMAEHEPETMVATPPLQWGRFELDAYGVARAVALRDLVDVHVVEIHDLLTLE